MEIECPICSCEFSEHDEQPDAEHCIFRCPDCSAHFFVGDDWDLIHNFEPMVQGNPIRALLRRESPNQWFRLADFGRGSDVAWIVYVARNGDLMIYKGLVDYEYQKSEWESRPAERLSGFTDRRTSSLRQHKGSYLKLSSARVIAYAWHDLSENENAIVEHRNDERSRETANDISLGSPSSNQTNRHEARRSGKQPKDQPVYRIRTLRSTVERLSELSCLKGEALDRYVDQLLKFEISRLESGA